MHVVLERTWRVAGFTIGRMFINGTFFSNVVEDEDRHIHQFMQKSDIQQRKIAGRTAIPYGQYRIVMDYSPRFKKAMPHIYDVPCFEGVRIHAGNKSADTEGCLILGFSDAKEDTPLTEIKDWVSTSKATCDKFYDRLIQAGGVATIEII